MQVGLSMYSLVRLYQRGELDVLGFLDYAAAAGLSGVELLDAFWKDLDGELPQVKAKLAETGLKVYAYSISNDLAIPDAAARATEVEKIRAGVRMAGELGAGVVRVFSGNAHEGVSYAQAEAWIRAGLAEGAAYAAERGVKLALENHGLFAGKIEQVQGVIEAVNSPALGATLDTGNFLLVGDDPVEAARRLGPKVALVHFKDLRVAGEGDKERSFQAISGQRFVGTVIGRGEVRLGEIVKILEAAGYHGYLSIEFEGPEDPRQAVEESIAFVRGLV